MRYNYYRQGNTVICVSRYNGKRVKATAKCNPEYDKFDFEIGKQIARLRVDMKIQEKKIKRAVELRENAYVELEVAQRNLAKTDARVSDAITELQNLNKRYLGMKADLKF